MGHVKETGTYLFSTQHPTAPNRIKEAKSLTAMVVSKAVI
jgi:hypothetical protein